MSQSVPRFTSATSQVNSQQKPDKTYVEIRESVRDIYTIRDVTGPEESTTLGHRQTQATSPLHHPRRHWSRGEHHAGSPTDTGNLPATPSETSLVQRRAPRWVTDRHRQPPRVHSMLQELDWPTLQARLGMLFIYHITINLYLLRLSTIRKTDTRKTCGIRYYLSTVVSST